MSLNGRFSYIPTGIEKFAQCHRTKTIRYYMNGEASRFGASQAITTDMNQKVTSAL